ncbi:hypothetical protein KAU43_09575 [candidate division WOR-3 bacterium]|nr:hypothetical protein [candidate division WOR-3 bacterium]
MLKVRKNYRLLLLVVFLLINVKIFGFDYSIKSDSMKIIIKDNLQKTIFYDNIRFLMNNVLFTSENAMLLGDSLFVLIDSVKGVDKKNRYYTDTLIFYQNSSVAEFFGNNTFYIEKNILKGKYFLFDLSDSSLSMENNIIYRTAGDTFQINANKGYFNNNTHFAEFYNSPVLSIFSDSDTIVVKSDTIKFANDSIVLFVNNFNMERNNSILNGDFCNFNIRKENGIISGNPVYRSKDVLIKGDTVIISRDESIQSALFYNNAEIVYNRSDSLNIHADSILIKAESDSTNIMHAYGNVEGRYFKNEE